MALALIDEIIKAIDIEFPTKIEDTDVKLDDDGHGHGSHDCGIPHELMRTQSPINFITNDLMPLSKDEMKKIPFKIKYPSKIKGCHIINNGYTVQVNIPSDVVCEIYLKGDVFKLIQFHFHCPSEHTINDKSFNMEMHLVHLNKNGDIAVMGFIFDSNVAKSAKPKFKLSKSKHHLLLEPSTKKMTSNLGSITETAGDDVDDELLTDDDMDDDAGGNKSKSTKDDGNVFLKQFFDELVYKKTENKDDIKRGGIPLKGSLSFDFLFETSSNKISKSVDNNEIEMDLDLWEYMGSLTTPPFTEGVHWYVIKKVHYMSQKQLTELRKCWPHESNARDTQKLHGRIVKVRSGISVL